MKLFKYLFLAVAVFWFASCSETLEEINTDPTVLTDVELRLILPEIQSQQAFNEGTNTGRVTGIIMQQFFGVDAQQEAYNRYVIGQDAFDNYWRTGLYTGVLRSCDLAIQKATAEGTPFYAGVAKVIMANEYGKTTCFFGDIPLTDALKGLEVQQPGYDSQESVFTSIQGMLDAAITDLSAADGGYAGGDLIFGGDASAWIATANALKARYNMVLSKRNSGAASAALTNLGNAFSSLSAQPNFAFGTAETENYSLAKFGLERPSTLEFNPGFHAMMDAKNDPRLATYVTVDGDAYLFHTTAGNLVWSKNDAVIPLISFAEVKFLEAEALARTNASAAMVSAALTDAITANMQNNGIAAADYADYVAANGTVSGSMDDMVQKIIEEAYVAYYGYNFSQTWNNYRRTGHPALTPNANADPGFNPSGVVPRRYLYPESEFQTNRTNVEAAVSTAGGGGLQDVDVWAFQ